MKKKLVSLLLVAMMVASSLTGCGTVTAESLIDDAFKDIEYAEYEMNMTLKMDMSYSGMSIDADMKMNAEIEASDKVAYTKVSLDAEVMGMETTEETESYVVINDDTMFTYTYNDYDEEWYYTESDVDKDNDNLLPKLESDMFEDLEMEKTDDGYEVTGVITEYEDLLSGTDDETTTEVLKELKDIDANATLIFNKNKEIEEISIEFDVDEDEELEIEGMEVTISEMKVTLEFKSFDGNVELPKDVEDDAIEMDSDEDIYDDYEEDDDEYSGEEFEPVGGISGNTPSLDNIVFEINGNSYALGGFTLDDIKSLGYEIDDYKYTEGDEFIINAGDYEYISLYDDNVCSMTLYFKNNTDGALDILECDLAGITFDQEYEMENEGGAHCNFSINGVTVGTSYTDAEYILGSPDSYGSYDDTIYYTYYLDEDWDASLTLYFDVEDGLTGFDVHSALYDY